MPKRSLQIGDIVTRTGTDRHLVEEVDCYFGVVSARCLESDTQTDGPPIYKIGEIETLIEDRWILVQPTVSGTASNKLA
jgi:hypothetical protein